MDGVIPAPFPRPTFTRSDWVISGALLLVGLALAGVLVPAWLHVEDDGLYMYQANLVLHGGVPYRDFLHHDGPLGTAWHALLLGLFGNDDLVLRLGVLPFKALLLPAVYGLSRPLLPRAPALVAALMVPIVDTNLTYMTPHVALNALACGVGAVLLLAVWLRRPRPGWLVAAGVVLGLMAGFKQNMGLYLLGASLLWLLDLDLPSGTSAAAPGADRAVQALRAGAWGAAVLCTLALLRAHLEPGVIASLVLPILALAGAALVPRSRTPTSPRALVGRGAPLLAGFAAGMLPWLVWVIVGAGLPAVLNGLLVAPVELSALWFAPLRDPDPAFWTLLGLYAGGVILAAATVALARWSGGRWTWLPWAGLAVWGLGLLVLVPLDAVAATGLPYVWLYFNLLVFWPAFVLVQRLPAGSHRSHARLLLLTSAFLALEMYPQLRRVYANWCFVLFLPLAAWGLWTLAQRLGRIAPAGQRGRPGAAPAVALLVLPLLAGWWMLDWRARAGLDVPALLRTGQVTFPGLVPLDLPHFHIWETPAHRDLYRDVVAGITARTAPGERIYCFYRQLTFYVAAERPAAVQNVYAPPGITVAEATAMRDQIEQEGVRVILADNNAFRPEGPLDLFLPDRVATWAVPLRDYLTSRFQPVQALGDWTLWERR